MDDNNAKPKATQLTRRDALLTGAGVAAAVGVLSEASAAVAQNAVAKSAEDARNALKMENDLLVDLAKAALVFAENKNLTENDVAYALVSHWALYFDGWRAINEKLVLMTDADLDKELEKEMVRLGRFSGQINADDGDAGIFYLQRAFGLDIQDAASLIGNRSISK